MRSLAVLGGIIACATSQLIPLDQISGLATPALKGPTLGKGARSESFPYDARAAYQSTYNSVFSQGSTSQKRTAAAKRSNGDCSPQPLGAGPTTSPDTPDAFVANPVYASAANGAQTPAAYVNTFQNLHASSQLSMGYLGYDSVSSYDPSSCASKCDTLNGCSAFNIYFERDPSLSPGSNCTNPASTTIIKCAYWGVTLEDDTATNDGQYDANFHIVIAGSNGYVRRTTNFPISGYTGSFLGNAAINAPTECNSYIGYQLFNDGQPFDPARCAAACEATSQYNIQYLNGRAICRFFDTYILNKNGAPQGQYCAMYTRSWDSSYATNTGQSDSEGNKYTISYSYIYSNTTDPGAQVCDATCMSQRPCPGSSSSSTTTTTTTTPLSSTTSTTSSTTTTTSPIITTKSTITTTFQTSTTRVTTTTTTSSTTTTSAKPTNTQCFKLRATGPSYLKSPTYLTLDNYRLSYSTSNPSSTNTIFSLDDRSRLTTISSATKPQPLARTIEQWWNPLYGSLSVWGILPVVCSKTSDSKLVCDGVWSQSVVWVNSKVGGAVMHGNCPGNGWDQATLIFEYVECPARGAGNGPQWTPWLKWTY